jgi:cell division protease FtsH
MQPRKDDKKHPTAGGSSPGDSNQNDGGGGPRLPQDWRRWLWPALFVFFLLWLILQGGSFVGSSNNQSGYVEVPYSLVRNQVSNVQMITFDADGVSAQGQFRSPVEVRGTNNQTVNVTRFSVNLPPGGAVYLQELFASDNPTALVEANAPQSFPLILSLLLQFLPFLLIIGFFVWMSRRAGGQMNGVFGFGRSQAREYNPEMPKITFDDVAGQDSAKRELVEIVDFLSNPEKYISLGARVPKGVLLVGPPGTGKTLMARAVAGEANCSFYSIAASEFVEMFVGVGASRVRDLFSRAKENSPAIVFIDEIDAVGRQRGAGLGGGNDEREQTLNQMLAELDGFDQSATVIVMAATNRPDVLDPALLRPGRFDRQVTVDLPDKSGRLSILKIHTRGKPLGNDVNLELLAGATIGFSGADLANLANEAALNAARLNKRKITQSDFSTAFERIILGTERPPLSNEMERKVTAYHEAGHAVASTFAGDTDPVLKITITPRGQSLGVTVYTPEDDRRNVTKSYLEAKLISALGGRVAEELVFGEITTGAAQDLRQVTNIARRMVTQFGMSEAIGPLNFGDNETQPFLGYSISQGRNYSEETAARIDVETRRIVESAYQRTRLILNQNRDKLETVAQELLTNEVIESSRFYEIIGVAPRSTAAQVLVEETPKSSEAGSGNNADSNGSETLNGQQPDVSPVGQGDDIISTHPTPPVENPKTDV